MNEIIERAGKYYMSCSDGEIEITRAEIAEQTEYAKYVLDFLKNAQSIYSGNKIDEITAEAEMYIRINVFFEYFRKAFDQDYHTSNNTVDVVGKYSSIAQLAIQELGPETLNPYDKNRQVKECFLEKYKAFIDFIGMYPVARPKPVAYSEFSEYLNEPGIVDELKNSYTNAKPAQIAYMLLALENIGALKVKIASLTQTTLHPILGKTFGNIGSRQALNGQLSKLQGTKDNKTVGEIKRHQEKICNFLAAKNAN